MAHAEQRLLKNAPITEAVIDIRVSLIEAFTAERLQHLRSELEPLFPEVEEQRQVEAMMQIIEGRWSTATSDQGIRRLVFKSLERSEVVLASDAGFTFSKLRPYTSWEAVFASARRFWEIYSRVVSVASTQRIAVRYINHFQVPRTRQIHEYLTTPPRIPEGIAADAVKSALTRLSIREPVSKVDATVIQVTDAVESGTTVMIDIDAFKTGELNPRQVGFWTLFQELRDAKNRIFFGSIHELAAEDFER